jgi:hypothetical protein
MILCDTAAQTAASNENSRKPLLVVNLRQAVRDARRADLGSDQPTLPQRVVDVLAWPTRATNARTSAATS